MRSIPHLNELHRKYRRKGLTIIGVTDEPAKKVRPFIEQKGIEYVIAIGGAAGYRTRGIPRAWLVSPTREIVWEGHPASLTDAVIAKAIVGAKPYPVFRNLPSDLRRAQAKLNRGQFASGLAALEKYLESPGSDEAEAAARAAIKRIENFARRSFAEVSACERDGRYSDALFTLDLVARLFKGTKEGTRAKELKAKWLKDKAIKAEIEAGRILEKAESLASSGDKKKAARLLKQLARSKKFAETKTRKRAVARLRALGYR